MYTSTIILFNTNDNVRTVDDGPFDGKVRHVCNGTVERTTEKFVFVRNQHGNLVKYHQGSGKAVGYSFPMLTSRIVPA